jgi:hypothetical protein
MFGAAIQGTKSRIEYWTYKLGPLKLPSLRTIPSAGLPDDDIFDVMGGVSAGMIYLTLSQFARVTGSPDLLLVFWTLGMLHLTYGVYELLFLRKWTVNKYMIGHYALYAANLLLWPFLWWVFT